MSPARTELCEPVFSLADVTEPSLAEDFYDEIGVYLLLACSRLTLGSCSKQKGPSRKETSPVKGEVFVDGKGMLPHLLGHGVFDSSRLKSVQHDIQQWQELRIVCRVVFLPLKHGVHPGPFRR
jgi:hypothetical protein